MPSVLSRGFFLTVHIPQRDGLSCERKAIALKKNLNLNPSVTLDPEP